MSTEWNEDWQHFWDDGCDFATHKGHGFLIVPDWDVVNHPDFLAFLSYAVREDVEASPNRDFWGFNDSYDVCSDCRQLLWEGLPRWITPDGDILCQQCTADEADDYIEWYQKEIRSRLRRGDRMIGFVLEPEEHGFTLVLPNLTNGMHHGDNDDPFALAKWFVKHNLQLAISVFSDPFTATFDIYLRKWDDEEYAPVALTEAEVAEIREALCERVDINPYHSHVTLRHEFREWPDLATRMEAALRGIANGH